MTMLFRLMLTTTVCATCHPTVAEPWTRHVIDDSSRGADGVRLADVNGDGRPDITTGWEEGGVVRVYLHPEPKQVQERWPAITVGHVRKPEDAVFFDVNSDGRLDVVSSCEGGTKTVYAHLAPAKPQNYDKEDAWRTESFPAVQGAAMWMFALPFPADDPSSIVLGAKGPQASIGMLSPSGSPSNLSEWEYQKLRPAGWIMSLMSCDMNGDGRQDLLCSDRKGSRKGVFWLEPPVSGDDHTEWREHPVRANGFDATPIDPMFIDAADLDADGLLDVIVPTWSDELLILFAEDRTGDNWSERRIRLPFGMERGKGVRVGDIDGDGRADITLTMRGPADQPGVAWLKPNGDARTADWQAHDISGPAGTKFDRIELLDLDGDGDLDLLTCEEVHNLGVIWYENPLR